MASIWKSSLVGPSFDGLMDFFWICHERKPCRASCNTPGAAKSAHASNVGWHRMHVTYKQPFA